MTVAHYRLTMVKFPQEISVILEDKKQTKKDFLSLYFICPLILNDKLMALPFKKIVIKLTKNF